LDDQPGPVFAGYPEDAAGNGQQQNDPGAAVGVWLGNDAQQQDGEDEQAENVHEAVWRRFHVWIL